MIRFFLQKFHDGGGWAFVLQFLFHPVHVGGDVCEEAAIAFAKVVQSGFSIGSFCEAVLGTFPVAGEEKRTLFALPRQTVVLGFSERHLPVAVHQFQQCVLMYVSQMILRKDEVVATEDVSVPFDGSGVAALFCQGADARLDAHPVCQCGVEDLDEEVAHVVAHPFVEDFAEEVSPFFGRHAHRHHASFSCFRDGCQFSPVGVSLQSFHDGCELDVVAVNAAEEVIEGERVFHVHVVHDSQGVPFHFELVEQFDALHDLHERRSSGAASAIAVVHLLWSVDADPDEPAFFFEKLTPFRREECSVGLDAVVDGFACGIFLLQFNHSPVETDGSHECFPAVPGDEHGGGGLRLNVLFDEKFERFIAHDLRVLPIVEFTLFEIVAVVASQIAL